MKHVFDQQPVKAVTLIDGRDEVELLLKNRADQRFHPLGRYAQKVCRNQGAGLGTQQIGSSEDHPQGPHLALDAGIMPAHDVHRSQGIGGESRPKIGDGCRLHRLGGSVVGASVRIDQDAAFSGVILDKSNQNRVDHALDGCAVVQSGDTDQNVHSTHRRELAHELIGEKAFFGQKALQSQWRVVSG